MLQWGIDLIIEDMNIEDALPENLDSLRRSNDRIFHSSPSKRVDLPREEELLKLMEDGYGGVVRSILQKWMQANEPRVRTLELLILTDDETIQKSQYIEWCNELISMDGENEVALEFQLYYNEQKRKDNSIVDRLSELYPENVIGKREKVKNLIRIQDYSAAFSVCEEILLNESNNSFALRNRAVICSLMNRNDEAAYFWSEWLETGDAPVEDWHRAARAHYNCKHYSETVAIIEQIIADFPEREKILDLYIRANYSLFNWEKCAELCEELLEINSRSSVGLKYLRLTKARIGPKMAVIPLTQLDSKPNKGERNILFWHDYI